MLSFVVLGAWRSTGIPFFLGIAVASMLALIIDAVVAFVSMRKPTLRLRPPESKILVVNRPQRLEVVEATPAGALVHLVSSIGGSISTRAGSGAPIVAQYSHRSVHTDSAGTSSMMGPLGLVVCERRFLTPLAFAVGPEADQVANFPEAPSDEISQEAAVLSRGADITRSVRPYRRGDQQTAVAWKATARAGELMVRELEGGVETEVVMVLQLRQPKSPKTIRRKTTKKSRVPLAEHDELNEDAVSRAAAYAKGALRSGKTVRLIFNQEISESAPRAAPRRRGKMRLFYTVGDSAVANEVVRSETHLAYLLASAVPGGDLRAYAEQEAFVLTATGDTWVPGGVAA